MVYSKKTIQLLLISIIGIILIVYVCGCYGSSVLEGYTGWQGMAARPAPPAVTEEDVVPLRKELEGLFFQAGEALCPSFNMVKDEIAKGKKGSAAEKEAAAVAQMRKEAGGKIYDCRSYPDHLQVPADIGAIVEASAVYLDKKLGGLLERVEAALSCKPLPIVEDGGAADENSVDVEVPAELKETFIGSAQRGEHYRNDGWNDADVRPGGEHYRNVTEYYADVPQEAAEPVCSPEQMKTRDAIAAQKAAAAAAASCKAPTEISYAQQKQLLETRIKNLSRALKDPAWGPRITRIQGTLRRFQEIKAKVDAGTLVPNCGPNF